MSKKSHSDLSDVTEEGIKKRIWALLDKNPLLKPKPLCKLTDLNYDDYKGYVKQLRYLWKKSFKLGLGSKRPKMHHVRAYCYLPKCCDRKLFPKVEKEAVEAKWTLSKNRNRTLIWNEDPLIGRIEWFTTGRVIIYVKKPQTMGRVKQLLSTAFLETGLIFDWNIANQFLEKVDWKSAHDVFETAERLPYKVIDRYVESHGILIKAGDATHPNAYEVEWCKPDWLEELELMKQQNIKVIETDGKAFQRFNQILEKSTKPAKPVSDEDRSVV